MCSGVGDTTQLVPGSPIRTPWDHSSVDSSPRPIAASHVLHRLLVPRHPPCALSNLTTKMLASTMQHSTNTHPHPPHAGSPTPTPRPAPRGMLPRSRKLLRKEVIQPHLPVRLPCYDFVPIASPTFDRSLRNTG